MKIGNDIRHLRFHRGEMTQEDVGNAIGVTRQTIHMIEKGKYIPSIMICHKLARLFEKPLGEVFFVIEEDEPEKK